MESGESPESTALVVTPNYPLHPFFTSQEGDLVLQSKNGVKFRCYQSTLKTTSEWFRSMLSLPQPENDNRDMNRDVLLLYVDEDDQVLEHLLRMVSGLPLLPIVTFDLVDALLYAADKYDMAGPISIIRMLVMTPPLINPNPLRLYAIATRFGWDREAKLASTQTLSYNIHAPEYRILLQRLSTEALLNLFDLHRNRREGLRLCLDSPPFVPSRSSQCVSSGCRQIISYHAWIILKYKITLEMDVRPLGDTILDHALHNWPEAIACWNAKCACQRVLFDKDGTQIRVQVPHLHWSLMSPKETIRVVRECIEGLPSSTDSI